MAKPRVVAALMRRFSDLNMAEEAYQEACVRALERWPSAGLPNDPSAWLLIAGRNTTIDRIRRDKRISFSETLPESPVETENVEVEWAERIDMS